MWKQELSGLVNGNRGESNGNNSGGNIQKRASVRSSSPLSVSFGVAEPMQGSAPVPVPVPASTPPVQAIPTPSPPSEDVRRARRGSIMVSLAQFGRSFSRISLKSSMEAASKVH